ncbi:hypothetical protein SDC9_83339 [bioreactor metagenome]|uniref:Uncharacterized protein n=1 Tax=bioreactor metagenome TaxID=1076179 RepID=A0A644Z7X5_9ZZZZ
MHRVFKQFVGGGLFHTLPQVHHDNFVGNMLDHRQVVGNEHVGESSVLLDVHKKVKNLCLD